MAVSGERRRTRRRIALLVAIWVLPSAILMTLAWRVQAHYHIPEPAGLSDEARQSVVDALRETVATGEVVRPQHPDLSRRLVHGGPVSVELWAFGKRRIRVWARADTLVDALALASADLLTQPMLRNLRGNAMKQSRFKVDISVGRGPLSSDAGLARALGLHPGLEGLGVHLSGEQVSARRPTDDTPGDGRWRDDGSLELLMPPDELIAERLLLGERPLSFVPDLQLGLSFERADKKLEKQAKSQLSLPQDEYRSADRRYFRFRTISFVEASPKNAEPGPPIPLARGVGPRPEVTAANLRAGALAGGRYLVAHLADNGRYIYNRNLYTGRGTDPHKQGAYSIPRHAGTTYFLAELLRLTGEDFLREPVERAFAHLSELIDAGKCRGQLPGGESFACVLDRGRTKAHLGSSALTVVALVEYRRATGDGRYDQMARELAEWILFMQRTDGSFVHVYDVPKQRKLGDHQLLYYSGEAALALARMHAVYGDERYRDAAERALDHIVGWYDFFIGGFFYGEEHWTCIAAEAIYPAVAKAAYVDFCHGYAAFLRTQQVGAGELPAQLDYAGSYNFTPFLVPMNTPAGSRTESMISAYLLGRAQGRPDEAIRQQILDALGFLLGRQVRADTDYFVPSRVFGLGAVPASPVDWTVRIDYVQHVGSAMIRAAELIETNAR